MHVESSPFGRQEFGKYLSQNLDDALTMLGGEINGRLNSLQSCEAYIATLFEGLDEEIFRGILAPIESANKTVSTYLSEKVWGIPRAVVWAMQALAIAALACQLGNIGGVQPARAAGSGTDTAPSSAPAQVVDYYPTVADSRRIYLTPTGSPTPSPTIKPTGTPSATATLRSTGIPTRVEISKSPNATPSSVKSESIKNISWIGKYLDNGWVKEAKPGDLVGTVNPGFWVKKGNAYYLCPANVGQLVAEGGVLAVTAQGKFEGPFRKMFWDDSAMKYEYYGLTAEQAKALGINLNEVDPAMFVLQIPGARLMELKAKGMALGFDDSLSVWSAPLGSGRVYARSYKELIDKGINKDSVTVHFYPTSKHAAAAYAEYIKK